MNRISVGTKVYCDLHSKSVVHTVTGIMNNGWVVIDSDFYWPLSSCFPVERTRRCAVCGKPVLSGFLFDETICLCDKECAIKFFDNDEGCVDILIDDATRLVWHDKFEERTHYLANVNHYSDNCFHYFDDEKRMFEWISEMTGEKIETFYDCKAWTKKQQYGIAHTHGYIKIRTIDPFDYYKHRREYVAILRKCDDLMQKAQRVGKSVKRDNLLFEYNDEYELAGYYQEYHPEVWHGEI